MKKLSIIIAAVLSLLWNESNSQNLIAVHHSGAPTFYTGLPSAITNAQDGDTIYIPGGSFGDIAINKRLHLVGVGYNSDSTNATARTILGNMTLQNGSDYGSITGVYLNGNHIYITGIITNYGFSRCYVISTLNYSNNTSIGYFTIKECIFANTVAFYGGSYSINNNIFGGGISAYWSTIKNNIFLAPNSYTWIINNCIVDNNIFKEQTAYLNSCTYNVYHNNVNTGCNGVYNTNQGSGNFISPILPLSSVFVNYAAGDYHLIPGSPFVNAGRDGTDIGTYGGVFPMKAGAVPFNPHFQTFLIGSTTDSTGNLPVNIKVSAQDR